MVTPTKKVILGGGLTALVTAVLSYFLFSKPQEVSHLKELNVLTYDAFAGLAGPGPELRSLFMSQCGCSLRYLSAPEGGLMLEKLKLKQLNVDVVLGLDQLMLSYAEKESGWLPLLEREPIVEAVTAYEQEKFAPYDWAPLVFIYKSGQVEPPQNLAEIFDQQYRHMIALQDPRLSTPGIQFLFTLSVWAGPQVQDFLLRFREQVHSVSPSWAASYGLFQRQQAKIVFSYLSSLIYHWQVERDKSYQPIVFSDGHPIQVEFAGVPAKCRECELGREFVSFLRSEPAQKIIRDKNFMFPVRPGLLAHTPYEKLPSVQVIDRAREQQFLQQREALLRMWSKVMH